MSRSDMGVGLKNVMKLWLKKSTRSGTYQNSNAFQPWNGTDEDVVEQVKRVHWRDDCIWCKNLTKGHDSWYHTEQHVLKSRHQDLLF